jgi:voltage-gated potassium channel
LNGTFSKEYDGLTFMNSRICAELDNTLTQLDGINPSALPVTTLQQMQKRIREQLSQLNKDASTCLQAAQSALDESDPDVIGFSKRKKERFRLQAEHLNDLHTKLETSIQKGIIRGNMIRQLGSARRLAVLEAFIMGLIVLVLGLLVYDISCDPHTIRPAWLSSDSIFQIDLVCCCIFMAEFMWRLSCAESKRYVWKHHWVDFVTSIPIPGAAQLARFGRVARVARFARLLRLLRFARLFFILWRGMDKLQDVIDVGMMKKTIRWAVVATCIGAIVIYKIEGAVEVNADGVETSNSVGTMVLAIWWSFTTVLTGGFGDIHNPTSISGQIVTGILVITGMVFVGVFTATLTSLFVGEQSGELERLQDELGSKLDQISERLEQLERR